MRAILLSVTLVATAASAAEDSAKPDPIAPGVRETQLTVSLDRGGKRTQFQATVVGKDGATITVLTAGHGLGPADVGAPVRLRRGEQGIGGRVEAVTRNPHYRPGQGDIPGADNAVARFRLDAVGTLPMDDLKTAEVIPWAIPAPAGQTVRVQMIDQFGHPHVLKSGNYTNPRWLEWGPTYRPIAGDSGSGVFILRTRPDGTVGPLLIGVIVDRSDRGGGASLVHRTDKWVSTALKSIANAR